MNIIDYKIENKKREIAAFIWTIICICLGIYILDIMFSDARLSSIVSVLMPLYFLVWLTVIFTGHYLIQLLINVNFYSTSILGAEIDAYMERGEYSSSVVHISWVNSISNKGVFPRLTPNIDTTTSSTTEWGPLQQWKLDE